MKIVADEEAGDGDGALQVKKKQEEVEELVIAGYMKLEWQLWT